MISNVNKITEKYNGTLILVDHNVSIIYKIKERLTSSKIFICQSEPSLLNIHLLISSIKFTPEKIICIGGGSTIDTGKMLSIFYASSDFVFPEKYRFYDENIESIEIIVFSSTFSTGAEVSPAAVYFSNIRKMAIVSSQIIPNEVFYVKDFYSTLPQEYKLLIAFDAVCHSIEGVCSKKATPTSNLLNITSINTICEIFSTSDINDVNIDILIDAFTQSSIGSQISGANIIHALSSPLSKHFNLIHGDSVLLIMYAFRKFTSFCNYLKDNFNRFNICYGNFTTFLNKVLGSRLEQIKLSDVNFNYLEECVLESWSMPESSTYKFTKNEIIPLYEELIYEFER
jgi:alcohol dehydrogenase class IV